MASGRVDSLLGSGCPVHAGDPARTRLACASARMVASIFIALACIAVVPPRAYAGEAVQRSLSDYLDRVEMPSEGSATFEGSTFGLTGFERLAKGTARSIDGAPEGYRIPLSDRASVVAIRTPEMTLVHIDEDAARQLGSYPLVDESDFVLWSMICALDEAASMGGALLSSMDVPYLLVYDDVFTIGDYRYRFNARAADGSRFATVTWAAAAEGQAGVEQARAAGIDLGAGALWCDYAELVSAADVVADAPVGPVERVVEFLSSIDFRPFWVSLKTSGLALVISFVLGLFAAWRVVGTSSRIKGLLDSVFTIPMVLPPTVCGFLLLMLFGQSTAVGRWLIAHGVSLVFTWQAAVISAVVVSFPLVYRTALGAFESLDARMLDAARTLGWSEPRIFRKIMLPLAWPSIAAGTVLAFARAMGEFGCTLFFAGNYAGITQTIPIAIYFEWMGGNTSVALFWVVVVIAFSFLVVWGINAYTARHQGHRGGRSASGALRSTSAAGRRRDRAGGISRLTRFAALPDHVRDGLEETGGDALCIDREALRSLFEDGAQ